MKKILLGILLSTGIFGCSDSKVNNTSSNEGTAPKAMDSTIKHPDGVTNGSVISTDTAAMNPNNKKPGNQ